MECIRCGCEIGTGDLSSFICNNCRKELLESKDKKFPTYIPWGLPSQSGWVCPKCGAVYGPSQTECYRCNTNKYVTTCKTEANNEM